jgi:hypothetical protein
VPITFQIKKEKAFPELCYVLAFPPGSITLKDLK